MTGKLPDVTDANFQADVLDSETPTLVDFWAPWCGPCRVVHPILEEIAAEREDLRIVSLNVDDNQQTAGKLRGALDPDADPVQGRRRGEAGRRRDAEAPARVRARARPGLVPYVHIHWFEGRDAEQKAELAKRITEAMEDVAKMPPDQVWIRFDDARRADWAMAGEIQEK